MKSIVMAALTAVSASAFAANVCLIESYNQITGNRLMSNLYCDGAFVKSAEGRGGLTGLLQDLVGQGYKIDGLAAGELDTKVMWHTLSR